MSTARLVILGPLLFAGVALALPVEQALAASAASSSVEEAGLQPGSVVRWPGAATACAIDGQAVEPVAGECLFPVDLLATGSVTLERTVAGKRQRTTATIGDYPYPQQHIQLKDTSRVNLSPANQQRAARERQRIDVLWDRPAERRFRLPLAAPLDPLPEGGRFGSRRVFNGEPRNPHTGSDYAVPAGTPVLSVAAGRVMLAEEHFFAGNSVFIDHGDQLVSMYFHLRDLEVEAGDEVERGQLVGTVGSTGRSTGPHLHLGLRWKNRRVDPAVMMTPPAELTTLAQP
ncbi:MAG: M23 family metallopeptidase [Acidobacteriota bacterium]